MYHHAGIIHEHPTGFGGSFTAAWLGVGGFEGMFFDAVGDGFQLPLAGGGAHDKVVYIR